MRGTITQLLCELKTIFFNEMELTKGRLDYGHFLEKILLKLKQINGVSEVAFFKLNDCQQLYIEASTEKSSKALFEVPAELFQVGRRYYYRDFPSKEIIDYSIVLLILREDRVIGLLAMKENAPDSLAYITTKLAEFLTVEVAKLLETAWNVSENGKREKRYKHLFGVTEKFHSSMSMDTVLGETVMTLQEVYPTFTYYLLISQDHDNVHLPIRDLGYNSENGAVMEAYVTGTVTYEWDIDGKESILYAPLKGKQGVYGVLQVNAPNTTKFPESEIEFITLLAQTAGSALENAQLYQQSKRLISDLQLINETSHQLNSNLRLSETMELMKKQIVKSFHAQEIGFVLFEPNGVVEFLPGNSEFFQREASSVYIEFLKKKMNQDKEALFIGDLSLQQCGEEVEYRSLMAVPMTESDLGRGFAIVLHKEPYYFSFEMFKLLQSLIYNSSLALANSMLREELEKMVITDHLTGLYSRSHLDEKIYESMEIDNEGTFILIDIDDFKKVNDTYGHQIGDDILIQVSRLMQANVRESDIGARWGGEELAIYLPGVHLNVGVGIAQRLLRKVGEISSPKVTISCGVSYWTNDKEDNAKALFKRADEALYLAKNTGKNKVLVQNENTFSIEYE